MTRIYFAVRVVSRICDRGATGRRVFEKILAIASWEHSFDEDFGFEDYEIVSCQIGAVT
jgi:hypothetical protein